MGLTLLEIQALTASLAANGRVPSTVPPPAATGTITGIIPATGATQTAGTGFVYTHTNGSGIYVFTFTTAFAAVPVVLAQDTAIGFAQVQSVTANGFTVKTVNSGTNTLADDAFSFLAQAVT